MFLYMILKNKPNAIARIAGNKDYSELRGIAEFYNVSFGGVVVNIEVDGLPHKKEESGFFGCHIHEFGNCTQPFDKTGNHYNPEKTEHPYHAGDLPPLLGNGGYAWISFYDRRFTVDEIIGKSIVIHEMMDDFTTQPSGGSGTKIGCGVIERGYSWNIEP